MRRIHFHGDFFNAKLFIQTVLLVKNDANFHAENYFLVVFFCFIFWVFLKIVSSDFLLDDSWNFRMIYWNLLFCKIENGLDYWFWTSKFLFWGKFDAIAMHRPEVEKSRNFCKKKSRFQPMKNFFIGIF